MDDVSPAYLVNTGKQCYTKREFEAAANAFAQAAERYVAQGDLLNAAEARNNQCVALLQAKRLQEALAAVEGTAEIFAQAGDLRRQGMALANRASVLEALKRPQEALNFYRQAASLLEQAGEDQARAEVLRAAASLNAKRGRFTDMLYDEQDALLGVKKPTFKQRLLKILLWFAIWKRGRIL